jgi:hypothetical protein
VAASYDEAEGEGSGKLADPVLRSDPESGQLTIGNFRSISFAGSAAECLNLGQGMLRDARHSAQSLEVMVETPEITVAKICAANGMVVITCRNNAVTISPRHPRPDDRCQRVS